MNTIKLNRREFFRNAGVVTLLLLPVVSCSQAFAESRRGTAKGAEPALISDSDPQARAASLS